MCAVLAEQLGTIDERRIVLNGPDVLLDAHAAYVIALLVHELAVNAQKYGALASSAGHVSLTWSLELPDASLDIEWVERGGPIVKAPRSTGFGTELVRALAGLDLATTGMRYESSGVVCKLRVPLERKAKTLFAHQTNAEQCLKPNIVSTQFGERSSPANSLSESV